MMNHGCGIGADQIDLHRALKDSDLAYGELQRKNEMRVLLDIALDWLTILAMTYFVWRAGSYAVPVAIIVVANRQRAMGNLLHDAGHRNLFNSDKANDLIATFLLAPALFNSLAIYRKLHSRHHAFLGDPLRDPDYITSITGEQSSWWLTYRKYIFSFGCWRGSVMGHLGIPDLNLKRSAYIYFWWLSILAMAVIVMNIQFALTFFALWMIAKASMFHLVTTFREMCDHFGLEPGGIFSFTRDVSTLSPWRWIVHPRNNGYHLTHHLMPAVPYYRLHQTHEMLIKLPHYMERSVRCSAYFYGKAAVIQSNG
ncbi:fatty acid desaturase [Collimonas fungivorans]|uniref:fatty acid desaturase n=1 Tax=Collimonas fungivorans TaxID=158899 RepID=UPI00042D2DBC|nr:fatty acid desaturase [Collimonas fungivorans]